jgi:hypothetical protein
VWVLSIGLEPQNLFCEQKYTQGRLKSAGKIWDFRKKYVQKMRQHVYRFVGLESSLQVSATLFFNHFANVLTNSNKNEAPAHHIIFRRFYKLNFLPGA